jgi:hypothetical protein
MSAVTKTRDLGRLQYQSSRGAEVEIAVFGTYPEMPKGKVEYSGPQELSTLSHAQLHESLAVCVTVLMG